MIIVTLLITCDDVYKEVIIIYKVIQLLTLVNRVSVLAIGSNPKPKLDQNTRSPIPIHWITSRQ